VKEGKGNSKKIKRVDSILGKIRIDENRGNI
jgi:hypothetical protein